MIILALCLALLVGSNLIRTNAAKQNCQNVTTLRDAFDNVLTLADKQTPPGAQADRFYKQSHKELRSVTC